MLGVVICISLAIAAGLYTESFEASILTALFGAYFMALKGQDDHEAALDRERRGVREDD